MNWAYRLYYFPISIPHWTESNSISYKNKTKRTAPREKRVCKNYCLRTAVLLLIPTAVSGRMETTMLGSTRMERVMGKGLIALQMETVTLESTKMISDTAKALGTEQMAQSRHQNTKTEYKLTNWNNWCRIELCFLD